MKRKINKILASLLVIILLLANTLILTSNGEEKVVEIVANPSGYSIKDNQKLISISRLYQYDETANLDYYNLLCINHGYDISLDKLVKGSSVYTDTVTKNTVFKESDANKALWLLDNMYFAENINDNATKEAMKDNLKSILKENSNHNEQEINSLINSLCVDYGREEGDPYYLIYSVEQVLIWQYINPAHSDPVPNISDTNRLYKGSNEVTGNYKWLYDTLKSVAETKGNYVSPNASANGMKNELSKITLSNGTIDITDNSATFDIVTNSNYSASDLIASADYEIKVDNNTVGNDKYTSTIKGNKLTIKMKSNSGVDLSGKTINVKMNIKGITTESCYIKNNNTQNQNLINVNKGIVTASTEATAKSELSGKYHMNIVKKSAEDNSELYDKSTGLAGTSFKITKKVYGEDTQDKTVTTEAGKEIRSVFGDVDISEDGIGEGKPDEYKIEETNVTPGYEKIDLSKVTIYVYKKQVDKRYSIDYVKVTNDGQEVGSAKSGEQTNGEQKIDLNGDGIYDLGLEVSSNGVAFCITIRNPLRENADLSLRKFITKIDDEEINDREPVVDLSPLIDGTGTTANYTHTKDPEEVAQNQKVTYTIRVYNEGKIDAYASLIKDDIPDGLEFISYIEGDGSTNDTYRWKLVDEDNQEVTDPSKAKYIITDYLSKENESEGSNLIKAFDKDTMEELDYRDVKVEFKVTEPNTSDRIVINQAQISKETDKEGNDVKDRDSTADKWIDGEDDQDIEKVKVKYFDLALRKWVTQAIVTENGKTTVTETGHKAEDNPESVVKVDLKKSKINNVTVKFKYSIRITNEGEIAGEATEIRDDIPEGLKFVQEDNPDWREENGQIITNKLANTTLQPKESAEVEIILTWINSDKNMGVMMNTAEINKDHNKYDSRDIDSTPGNKAPKEDDIDDAPVMLTIKTGKQYILYVMIIGATLLIISSGIVGIKRYVLNIDKY